MKTLSHTLRSLHLLF